MRPIVVRDQSEPANHEACPTRADSWLNAAPRAIEYTCEPLAFDHTLLEAAGCPFALVAQTRDFNVFRGLTSDSRQQLLGPRGFAALASSAQEARFFSAPVAHRRAISGFDLTRRALRPSP